MRDDDFFWAGVDAGQLLLQQCADCAALRQPPGPMCPQCQSLLWQSHAVCGRGRVHTWLVSKHPSRADAHPRLVALIELEEGVRLVSNLREVVVGDVYEGMPVTVFFDDVDGQRLPQFRPAAGGVQ